MKKAPLVRPPQILRSSGENPKTRRNGSLLGCWRFETRYVFPNATHYSNISQLTRYKEPSYPHATEINAVLDGLYQDLCPYRVAGSILTKDCYARILLPWTIESPNAAFSKSSYIRTLYSSENRNGIMPMYKSPVDRGEKVFISGSTYIRWREAHPDLAGTDQDVVKSALDKIRKILGRRKILWISM